MTVKTRKITKNTTFRSPYADSNPLWTTIKPIGRQAWLCEIVNEKIEIDGKLYDGDYAGIQKSFLNTDIRSALNGQDFWQRVENEHERFYASLTPGQIVHYMNGFDAFVRCEVTADYQLKPIALLGKWSEYELPERSPDGQIFWNYYPQRVMDGTTFQPNASNIYEFHVPPHRQVKRQGADPRTMTPIDLTVPPMTSEQERVANLWKTVKVIQQQVEGNDPEVILSKISKLLKGYHENSR
jgi:hypothetical protein